MGETSSDEFWNRETRLGSAKVEGWRLDVEGDNRGIREDGSEGLR